MGSLGDIPELPVKSIQLPFLSEAFTAVLREAWATLTESSSRPLPATLAQSRNLAHASLETAVCNEATYYQSTMVEHPKSMST